jgi:hypothetical protein
MLQLLSAGWSGEIAIAQSLPRRPVAIQAASEAVETPANGQLSSDAGKVPGCQDRRNGGFPGSP